MRRFGPWRAALAGTAVLLGAAAVVHLVVGARLDDIEASLARDVERYEASLPHVRAPVGGPPVEGNAALLYAELEPTFGIDPDDPTLGPSVDLATPFRDLEAYLDGAIPEPDAIREFRSAHGDLVLAACRAGVRRTTYDFGLAIERGASAPLPNLLAYRAAASLLAVEARREAPQAALRVGLEIVAFGADLARAGSAIPLLMGLEIESLGLATIRRALEAGPIPHGVLREVARGLCQVDRDAIRAAEALEVERLIVGTELLLQLGRGHPSHRPQDSLVGIGIRPIDECLVGYWWPTYDALMRRLAAATELPYPEYATESRAIDEAIRATWNPIVEKLLPGVAGVEVRVLEGRAARRAMAVAVALFAARSSGGSFPEGEIAALAPEWLDAVPDDPFRPGTPLAYELREGGAAVRVFAPSAALAGRTAEVALRWPPG